MSKNVRKVKWSSPEITIKRKCLNKNLMDGVHETENLFLSDEEEDSFFTVSKLNTGKNYEGASNVLEDESNSVLLSLENDISLFCAQMTKDVNRDSTLFAAQLHSSSQISDFKEDTFLSKSVLDNVMSNCKGSIQSENKTNCLFSETATDNLTVSAMEKLLNDTPLELFGSPNKNSNTVKSPVKNVTIIKRDNSNNFHVDDSIFNTINLHSEQISESQRQLKIDDTFFANIKIEDLTRDEEKEVFTDLIIDTEGVQNSQRFLNDVAIFKVPHAAPPIEFEVNNEENTDTVVSTSQYMVSNDFPNTTVLSNLSRLDWDSQVFSDKLKNNFPSKGDFFGLPDRVKQMIFTHKGIKNLYG